ncbi:MAG: response regulator [Rhodopseudomonas sp.]|uniref:response regulator n=1 Tax=unclassified Rhodopseudomonas TaxID=2638247 RepID=UPI0013DEA5A6|nr:hybrid sensor histidine kinase/response regulator [Rhodopseudomonas sp. BR0M22]
MKNRVLHIDDDPAMLKIVAAVLARDPELESRGCLTGEEGVMAAADWLPDLILSDVSMPDMSGLDVMARLRQNERTAHIPVVLTTARGEPRDIAEYTAHGAIGIIIKPFSLSGLASRVRDYLDVAEAEAFEPPLPDIGIERRFRHDAETLRQMRGGLAAGEMTPELRTVVHKLAGVAGIFGFAAIGEAAARVEKEIVRVEREGAMPSGVLALLDALLELLERETGIAAGADR